jgi:DNA helicase II / ATP-dependent DNA helicase PcrA
MNSAELMARFDAELTPEQMEVVRAKGNTVVEACPGSGKTRTVAARLAYRMASWMDRGGLAVLSFTNVAEQEITNSLHEFGFPAFPGSPHFLGTLNSFVVQWLFTPFGHLVMSSKGLSRAPKLVMEYNEKWVCSQFRLPGKAAMFRVVDFHWNRSGNLEWTRPPGYWGPEPDVSVALQAKRRMAAAGYATHQDSMYWSLQVLNKFPSVADSLARRFPEMIVDEAQDTSDTQLHILGRLLKTGHTTLMFVGDADQGIYDFQKAQPEILKKLATKRGWKCLPISANFRSSQRICNAVYGFSSHAEPAPAKGKDNDCPWSPLLVKYEDPELGSLAVLFRQILLNHGLDPSQGVIVTRRNADVARLAGQDGPRDFPGAVPEATRRLIRAKWRMERAETKAAMATCEWFVLQVGFAGLELAPGDGAPYGLVVREWKALLWMMLDSLPRLDKPLIAWLATAKQVVTDVLKGAGVQPEGLGRLFPNVNTALAQYPAIEFVQRGSTPEIMAKTIHQAKGESHMATMVVATPQTKAERSEVLDWFEPVDASTGLRPEPVRRAYVAMTRPRKLLVVAVPSSCWDTVESSFAGFVRYDPGPVCST